MNAVIWTFERDQEGPAYVAGLDAAGRAVLLDVVDDVLRLLDGDGARTGQGPDHPLDRVRLNAPPVEPPVDPALRRQALAIAESVLDEVQLMPFTFCDPDDANMA